MSEDNISELTKLADRLEKLSNDIAKRGKAGFMEAVELARKEERERCARICEERAENRMSEHGITEPDTNASYYSGRCGEEYLWRDEEDYDCAEAILNAGTGQEGGTDE